MSYVSRGDQLLDPNYYYSQIPTTTRYSGSPEYSVPMGWELSIDDARSGGAVTDFQNRVRIDLARKALDEARKRASEKGTALDSDTWGILNNLTDEELLTLVSNYEDKANSGTWLQKALGGGYAEVKFNDLVNDILSTGNIPSFDYQTNSQLRERAAERANQEAQEQLGLLKSQYNTLSSNLLSKDYQNSMRNVDTLNSQMNRARQNALTAGASAGLRIASNVNTLLSNQNKQSQQSLDTANQLSQMLLNQRSAAQSIYNNRFDKENAYIDRYTSDYNADRAEYEDRLNREYGTNSVATTVTGKLNNDAQIKAYDEYNKSNNQTSQSNYN